MGERGFFQWGFPHSQNKKGSFSREGRETLADGIEFSKGTVSERGHSLRFPRREGMETNLTKFIPLIRVGDATNAWQKGKD